MTFPLSKIKNEFKIPIIKRVEVSNFKSFIDLKVNLNRYNVVIGPNASGKSNFLEIFKFLRDIINYGLENAISIQGGKEYIKNLKSNSKYITMKFFLNIKPTYKNYKNDYLMPRRIKIYEIVYEFTLIECDKGFEIFEDKIIQKYTLQRKINDDDRNIKTDKNRVKRNSKSWREIGRGSIVLYNKDGIEISIHSEGEKIPKNLVYPDYLKNLSKKDFEYNKLLIQHPSIMLYMPKSWNIWINCLKSISVYDFDFNHSKELFSITAKSELEENGSNLPLILKNINSDEEKKRKLFNLISDLLSFVKDVSVEKTEGRTLSFKIQEKYFGSRHIPASLISDGTINIIALIVALYFENKSITIIEEPDRSIHPLLISKFMQMVKEVSEHKQVIITTHNPELIKYANLKNLLYVSRSEEGYSSITRLSEKERIKVFLKNEIGIDELFIQDLLGE